ncbi:tetratricopeptide repeat protein [Fulvivirgaceae bacterium BMA12]|uniref:histidine kinase n=1 Tax=Agaribacillus aureus TaxID=3051825 RepID=A0ABT8L5F7_9BACT|nr:tetratricopeptide repeat protein [Fulvivirgaceae bacterium BMA12]
MKTSGILIQCLLFSFFCYAQENVDSLTHALKQAAGNQQVDIYNKLSSIYLRKNPKSALESAEKALAQSQNLNYLSGKAKALLNMANAHTQLSNYEKALDYYNEALQLFEATNELGEAAKVYGRRGGMFIRKSEYEKARDDLEKSLAIYQKIGDQKGLISANSHFGVLYEYQGRYRESLMYFLKSLEISKGLSESQDLQTMNLFINLGIIYGHLQLFDRALEYYLKGLAIADDLNDNLAQANVYNGIGIIYNEQGKNKEAISHYQKSLALYKKMGIKMRIGLVTNNIAVAYTDLNDFESALKFHYQSLSIQEEEGNSSDIVQSLRNIGEVYQLKGDFNKAIDFYERALKTDSSDGNQGVVYRKLGEIYTHLKTYDTAEIYLKKALGLENALDSKTGQMKVYKALSVLYESKGGHATSLFYYKRFTEVKDSLLAQRENDQFKELQTIYETELKEQQLVTKQQELDILQQQKEIDLFWRNVFLVGFILLGIGIIFVYKYLRLRNERKQNLLTVQTELNDQLTQIDQMKSQFFANISHEFRTPLTLILGPIDELIEEAHEKKAVHRLQLVKSNAQRLQKLINQMLDLSKVDMGKLELRASQQDIVALSKGIFFSFQSLSQKNQITQKFDCREEQIFLFFDQEKMEQILMNLLSNAFKFTREMGEVSMSLKRIENKHRSGVEITIKDTGVGIVKDHLPYIFDRFFQVSKADVKEHEGTGIGLALTKELTLLHKGTIDVESEIGEGTSFRLWFQSGNEHLSKNQIVSIRTSQVKKEYNIHEHDLQSKEYATENNPDNPAPGTGKPLVLIVEDHKDLRKYIKDGFDNDYNIIEASNGREGVDIALSEIPDLIISDVMMPEMDGYNLCKELKTNIKTSHIPIILLTAKTEEKHKIQGLENEADDYLVKPFNTKELGARVKNLILTRKKLQALFKSSVMVNPKEVEVSSMEEVFLQKLMDYMEEHVSDETFGVEQLSGMMGMSRVNLYRKMQAIMNCTPSTFIQRFRLERAKDLLGKNAGTIAEISYAAGFSSPTYFTKCFREYYGCTPKEHKLNEKL